MKHFSFIIILLTVPVILVASDPVKMKKRNDSATDIGNYFNLNAQDQFGCTILHRFATWGFENPVRVLLNHNADPTIQDNAGQIPLHTTRNVVIAQLLLDHKADVATRDHAGKSSLDRTKEYLATWDGQSITQAPALVVLLEKAQEHKK